jgi:TRAP-type C4-dicarboxylate transport system permease small subunit
MRRVVYKIGSAMRRLERGSRRFNAVVIVISSIFLFLIMLYIVSDSTGRFLFLHPMIGTIEIVESMLAFAIFLSMAATLISGQHIKVMVLVDRLPPRWQDWLEMFAFAAGFVLTFLIAYRSLAMAIHSYEIKEFAGRAYAYFSMPLYPARFAFFVGISLFCAQFLIQFLSRLFSRLAGEVSEPS